MKTRFTVVDAAWPAASGLLAAALVLAPVPSRAGEPGVHEFARLNDTGQSRCTRDFRHFTRDCAGTGQDADSGRDVSHPGNRDGHRGFSFEKVCNSGQTAGTGTCSAAAPLGPGPDDWACTRDRVTGLEWEVKTADGGLRDGGATYTDTGDGSSGDASGFVTAVDAAGLCGASDWRLPTTYELQGIDDFDRHAPQPGVDGDWFPHTATGLYWAADGYFAQPGVAWVVSTRMDGNNVNAVGVGRTSLASVRLVRRPAAAPMPAARFVASADGQESTDRTTGLVWRRCVEGMRYDGSHCVGNYSLYEEDSAYAHANAVAAATGRPWRVPNAKELHSIADETVNTPAIDGATFPDTPPIKHWTSTTISWVAPTGGWVVDFNDARVVAYAASYGFPVRLVRDAE